MDFEKDSVRNIASSETLDLVLVFPLFPAGSEKWKKSVQGKVLRVLSTGFSKSFEEFPHKHIIAKLNVYRLSLSVIKLIQSYLVKIKRRPKIKNSYYSKEDILFSVVQGSILDPILFFLSGLFVGIIDIDFSSYRLYSKSFIVVF